jgi:hypothetical protein
MYFLSVVKQSNKELHEALPSHYVKKVNLVTKKIELWHTNLSLKKQGSFNEDKEFIELGNSPSNFTSSSSSASSDLGNLEEIIESEEDEASGGNKKTPH